MDTIETIILTSIVNIIITGLVGGIVIYTVQKKIDASIQKSLFEHQVKFTRQQQKTVDVLENLYQKFKIYCETQDTWLMDTSVAQLKNLPMDRIAHLERIETVVGKMNEFWDYFEANRLFLSNDVISHIERIWESAGYWNAQVTNLLLSNDTSSATTETVFMANRLIHELEKVYKSVAHTTDNTSMRETL